MALNFPANPTIGDFDSTGSWQWDGEVWRGYQLSPSSALVSPTPPLNPTSGTIWYNTVDGTFFVYVNDGDSSQWVEVRANSAAAGTLGKRVDALEYKSPNYIINGAFDIWQRGVGPFTANGAYTADRWTGDFVTGAGSVTQQTFTPGTAPVSGYEGTYFLRKNVTTGAQFSSLIQRVEDVRTLAGQTVTLSFWAKGTNPTGGLSVNLLQTFGAGGSADNIASVVGGNSLSMTGSWARYSYTFNVPSIAGKTIGTNSYLWMTIYQSAANTSAWTLDIWGVQLEVGSTATAFRRNTNNIQAELAACQRYYYRNTPPSGQRYYYVGQAISATSAIATVNFPVTMRIAPSAVESSGVALVGAGAGGIGITSLTVNYTSENGMSLGVACASGLVSGNATNIVLNAAGAYLGFSAEL